MTADNKSSSARLIKKYPNRRLYDTKTSSYVTLADLKHIILKGEEIEVIELKTNDNITRQVLLQIILDEESKSPQNSSLLSSNVLLHMIRSYGNAMQSIMADYFEKNMQTFHEMQSLLGQQFQMGNTSPEQPSVFRPYWNPLMPLKDSQESIDLYLKKTRESFMEMQKTFQNQWIASMGLQKKYTSTDQQSEEVQEETDPIKKD